MKPPLKSGHLWDKKKQEEVHRTVDVHAGLSYYMVLEIVFLKFCIVTVTAVTLYVFVIVCSGYSDVTYMYMYMELVQS